MPIATGHPNIRNGVEKKTLNAATATPAAITSSHKGTALPGSPTGKETESMPIPKSNPTEIAKIMRPAWTKPGAAQIDPCRDKIHCSVQHVWTRNQNHAGADRYQPQ